ncbi:hypothetical protein ABPG74_014930 [Tetrahymena malaccensis]
MSVLHKYDRSFFTCSICLSDEFSNGGELPFSQILVIWINSNSSFEDIIEQVFIVKGDEYMKYIINGDCYLITPIGKIIKYNDVKSHQVKDYDIKKQQKLILRVFNNNQGQIDQIIK